MKNSNKHISVLFFVFFGYFLNAQDYTSKIEGRIYSKSDDVAAIHVSNITSNKGTITDIDGFFEILVKLNDTLVFSAIQYKRKEMVVDVKILEDKQLLVFLEASLTELNEVVVMPYNLSGVLKKDMKKLHVGPIITATTEKLPNAHLGPITKAERQLYTARTWDLVFAVIYIKSELDPLFNYFSGRTKMLNERVARDAATETIEEVRTYYTDSLYIKDLKIPKKNIDDFVYFCELDSSFLGIVARQDKLELWDFMKERSLTYRKNNDLD